MYKKFYDKLNKGYLVAHYKQGRKISHPITNMCSRWNYA